MPDERSRLEELLETVREIDHIEKDIPLMRDTDALQRLLEKTETIKQAAEDILAENTVTDGRTGVERVENENLAISDFDVDEVRELLEETIERAKDVRERVQSFMDQLEEKLVANAGEELDVTVNVKKNVNLKAAIRRTYGKTTKTITFDMYKQALELRSRHQQEDTNALLDDEIDIGDF